MYWYLLVIMNVEYIQNNYRVYTDAIVPSIS